VLARWSRDDGGKENRRQGLFTRERKERNQCPRGCFYRRSRPWPHLSQRRSAGKEQPSPAPSPGEKFEMPTSPDSHARRTRALISQVKRRVRSGHNGTVVLTLHARCLKRSALKRYVRVVPSEASSARPPTDQSRRAVSIGRRFHLAQPPADSEQKLQGGLYRVQIPSRLTPC